MMSVMVREPNTSDDFHDGEVLMVVNDRPLFDTERKQLFVYDSWFDSEVENAGDPKTLQTQPETPPSNSSSQSSVFQSRTPLESFNPFLCGVNSQVHQTYSNDDSEKFLEATADRIRTELLEDEMLELAAEAERAAASGQTKFSAQPCTFQEDSNKRFPRPEIVRRSYSEGGLLRRRSSSIMAHYETKLSVVDLRDVNEVFPSFKQFHIHLRTHFHRNKVDEGQLLFQERQLKQRSPRRSQAADFIKSFRLDQWVPRNASQSYFDRLSSHIATSPPRVTPKIDVPEGLPTFVQEHQTSYHTLETEASTTTQLTDKLQDSTSYLTPKDDATSATPMSEMAPRALFESDCDDTASAEFIDPQPQRTSTFDDEDVEPSQNSLLEDIVTPKGDNYASPDFVTPARLRTIRGIRKNDPEFERLVLPANSLSEESPMRTTLLPRRRAKRRSEQTISMPVLETVLDVSDSLTFNDSKDNSTIILPGFDPNLEDDEERDASPRVITNDMKKSMLTPTASREDDEETVSVPTWGLLNSKVSEPRALANIGSKQSPLGSQASDSEVEAFLVNRVDSPILEPNSSLTTNITPVKEGGQKPRKVKLSVYHGSGEKDQECKQSLQHSQIIRIEDSLTPLRGSDCGCLALSPVGSFEGNYESIASVKEAPSLRKSTSARALNKVTSDLKKGQNRLECAMEMISRFGADQKPLYVRSRENDDFLNNFLYCSKQPGDEEPPDGCEPCSDANGACGSTNTELCCRSIVQDVVTLGVVFPCRRRSATRNLVKLSSTGVPAAHDTSTWFDLSKSHAAFDRWVGGYEDEESRLNVSFQAPSLRKIRSDPSYREPSPIGDPEKFDVMFDIPKQPKHKHHLSYVDEQSSETLSTSEISRS